MHFIDAAAAKKTVDFANGCLDRSLNIQTFGVDMSVRLSVL